MLWNVRNRTGELTGPDMISASATQTILSLDQPASWTVAQLTGSSLWLDCIVLSHFLVLACYYVRRPMSQSALHAPPQRANKADFDVNCRQPAEKYPELIQDEILKHLEKESGGCLAV